MVAPASYTFTEEDVTDDLERVQNGESPEAPWPSDVGPFFSALAKGDMKPQFVRMALEEFVGKTLGEIEEEISKELSSDEDSEEETPKEEPAPVE